MTLAPRGVPHPDPSTVGEFRANLRCLQENEQVGSRAYEWREQVLAELGPEYGDDFPLVTLGMVAHHALPEGFHLTETEREAILWQHRRNVSLGSYQQALWDAIDRADDDGLDRLMLAYPAKVAAVRSWRNDREFVARLRRLPFAFSL